MSREIKFRAWHTQIGAMFFVGDDFGTIHPLDCCNYLRQGQPVTLMQFTGLKDKDGVEIYEGDLLKWEHSDHPLRVIWHIAGWSLFSKLFSRFGMPEGSECTSNQASQYARNSVVIGNIHESPELLEAK